MKVDPIQTPLPGERVLDVVPKLQPRIEGWWHRRLNLFTGRSLSDTALNTEQIGRTGRMVLRGQMLSPGVVTGLQVDTAIEDLPWFSDELPNGASFEDESWDWVSINPIPYAGRFAMQLRVTEGWQQRGFVGTTTRLVIQPGDTLTVYIFLDDTHPPRQIMMQWHEWQGDWEHRAYWGANEIELGTDDTDSRRFMGELPAAGRWVRLTVPAQQVGLVSKVVDGIRFTLLEGRATWDAVGRARSVYHVAAGLGLAATGEDVVVPQDLHVAVNDLPVYAPVAVLDGAASADDPSRPGALQVRKLGEALSRLIVSGVAAHLPPVGILLLQPITAQVLNNPSDARCDIDAQDLAFEDEQLIDGCRLVFYSWPTEWLPMPEPGNTADLTLRQRWRNRLAYTIFNQELKNNDLGQRMPWEDVGVPIALVSFDADWQPLFVDRHAVMRHGGKPKLRTALVANAGNPFLWQARIQQFAEQLAELDLDNTPMSEIAQMFRYAPPVGLLPKQAIAPRQGKDFFFPSSYAVQASPAPLEQLDAVIQASASLVAFDLFTPDQVQVLIPVPQALYDPHLLETATIDLEFQQTISRLVRLRTEWLYRRSLVRDRAQVLNQAITGKPLEFPLELDRQEEETAPILPFSSSRVLKGAGTFVFKGAAQTLAIGSGEILSLHVYLDPNNPPSTIEVWWIINDSIVRKAVWFTNPESDTVPGIAVNQWVRLEKSAIELDLEGKTLYGMAIATDGILAWGHVGKLAPQSETEMAVWFGDALPDDAEIIRNDGWQWVDAIEVGDPPTAITVLQQEIAAEQAKREKPFSSFRALVSDLSDADASEPSHRHLYTFRGLIQQSISGLGELSAYVYLDPDDYPDRLELWWLVNDEQERLFRACWGTPSNWGNSQFMGALPKAGQWSNLCVPAATFLTETRLVGLEGMSLMLEGGRAAVAQVGQRFSETEVVWLGNELAIGGKASQNTGWRWVELQENVTPFGEQLPPLPNLTEADYGTVENDAIRFVQLIEDLKAQLEQGVLREDIAELSTMGLADFIAKLEAKLEAANDRINLSFLRVHTDIYRIRQLVLGNDTATRLATSPAMAEIAQGGDSARATQQQIMDYYVRAKAEQVETNDRQRTAANFIAPVPAESAPVSNATPILESIARANPNIFTASSSETAATSRAFRTVARDTAAFNTTFTAFTPVPLAAPQIRVQPETLLQSGISLETFNQGQARISLTDAIKQQANQFVLPTKPDPIPDDVIQQAPNVGNVIRTTTIAARLQDPAPVQAQQFSVVGRYEVVGSLANIGINFGDAPIPGLADANGKAITFEQLKTDQSRQEILQNIVRGVYDPVRDSFESSYFTAGIKTIDDTVATLRIAEGVVQAYRVAIAVCNKTLTELTDLFTQASQRLAVIGNELSETRHDVSVARALLADEQARVKGVNETRDRILQEHVSFYVFCRPRVAETILTTPLRSLNPGVTEAALPACLGRTVEVPTELRAMVDLLREVPVRWFTYVPPLLDRFDRFDTLYTAFQSAKLRASVALPSLPTLQPLTATSSFLGQAIAQVVRSQQQTVMQYRLPTAQLNLNAFVGQSWRQTRDQAETILSLSDLIDARHGRSDVTQRAAQELEDIAHVAGCLYANFAEVLPVLRLEWAQILSQYDAPVNLRNLASLPRWGEIAYLERRETQTLVDWLYQRVDARQDTAVALINDLVRICILLASHAPVNQIISGRVAKQTTVSTGGRVELAIDPALVRVGMQVLMYSAENKVVAQGVVEDLSAGSATAKVSQTYQPNLQLSQNTRVQITESRSLMQFSMRG